MTVTIANAAGFWGDRIDAPRQTLERQSVDYLQLEYLAEVTMGVLQRVRNKDPTAGYATDFVEYVLPDILEHISGGVQVVTNAGGLNPHACARDTLAIAEEQGLDITVGVVSGDEITGQIADIHDQHGVAHLNKDEKFPSVESDMLTAAAYLGAQPIAQLLDHDVDIVITGRVTDPALALGPLSHEFGWTSGDWDQLAAGVVAGHLIECGTQVTGGNSLGDWRSINYDNIGYPVAKINASGDVTITKPPHTGGQVSRETVTQQLIYEIGDPSAYLTPDVSADFTSITIDSHADDAVTLTDITGTAPPETYKATVHHNAGYRLEETLLYSAPDALAKARKAADILHQRIDQLDLSIADTTVEYIGHNAAHGPAASVDDTKNDHPEVMLRFAARSRDKTALSRLAKEFAPLSLTGPPAVTGLTSGGRPQPQRMIGAWPTIVPKSTVEPKTTVYQSPAEVSLPRRTA